MYHLATCFWVSDCTHSTGFVGCADFAHFLDQALGSANEVETQLLISKNLHYITDMQYDNLIHCVDEIQKQLSGLIASIRKP